MRAHLPQGITLDLLVENMGRSNFGPGLIDRQGIVGSVTFDWQVLFNWELYLLPLNDLSGLQFTAERTAEGPCCYRGTFEMESI